MARHEIKSTIHILAQEPLVWEILTDFRRVPEWMKHVDSIHSPDHLAEGATLHIKSRMAGHTLETQALVTHVVAHRRLEWKHVQDLLDGNPIGFVEDIVTRFDLNREEAGTRLTAHVSFHPVGIKAKLGAGLIVSTYFKPQMEHALAALKKVAERAASPGKPKKQT